ncbi:MAG TPA: beta-ketoacyl synthase chain length factor [Thermoleophilia bacterium]|nr:beta-ketoacyl synthase chain length factor [Thermoleophilia bacterium]
MNGAYVSGLGMWTPGFRDVESWAADAPDAAITAPVADLLPVPLRRRVTPLTCMAADVATQAAREAGADLAATPIVLGSAYGEVATAVAMMSSFREAEGLPSPTRFHNSVHNTALAYLSIATGNRGFSTALAAGAATPAAALVEAWALLAERGGEVLLVFVDEPPPAPFAPANPYPAAAAALHLAFTPGPTTKALLSGLRRAAAAPCTPLVGGLHHHPCAGAFALVAAIARRARGAVSLGPFDAGGWEIHVEPAGDA